LFIFGINREHADPGAIGSLQVRVMVSFESAFPMPRPCQRRSTAKGASKMIGTGWRSRTLIKRSGAA